MTVDVENLARRFGGTAALDGVSLALEPGEFVALLGPSGSGKTTLLRVLAGLDFPDEGRVRIAGRDMAGVPARERGVGVVFQNYALFRHMSVAENVAFGLRVRPRNRRPPEAEIQRRVRELLELVQIPELAARYPDQVSGGQRQRVALARALAIEPQLLLLDEPFGALDALVRKEVRRWVRGLHDRLGLTSILVTHDQEEAMEMADRVAVMEAGRIVQLDTPDALLQTPATAFVAGFMGEATRLPLCIRGRVARLSEFGLDDVELDLPDGEAVLFLRPHEVRIEPSAAGRALVRSVRPEGTGGTRILADVDGHRIEGICAVALARGDACRIRAVSGTFFHGDGTSRRWSAGPGAPAPLDSSRTPSASPAG
ncbi:sulfate ABC transporter ATP-binding protein [Roseococcus sp. SYP-B2431]|uniref:sulfate/molybdate ABC transporter ATP-binding protein n=1 Tax=Roseococcus sp. SYP-B2431 TaxID=2496640 RepID=UPI00103BDACC|nr:sulfate ABC transporter ATP-binding protein [Roseococcus sp. SYP-B2431]TCH97351.1 sulfate ABC transporter ATP-binding protein [Roseococcus sp. SYP-B2431]